VRKLPAVVKAVIDTSLALLSGRLTEEPGWALGNEDFHSFMGRTTPVGGGGGAMSRAKDAGRHVKGITEAAGDAILAALVEAAGEKNAAAPRLRGLAATGAKELMREYTASKPAGRRGTSPRGG
jgi:hypothetical protein